MWAQTYSSVRDGVLILALMSTLMVYVAGRTDGAFAGQTSKELTDAFLRKYD